MTTLLEIAVSYKDHNWQSQDWEWVVDRDQVKIVKPPKNTASTVVIWTESYKSGTFAYLSQYGDTVNLWMSGFVPEDISPCVTVLLRENGYWIIAPGLEFAYEKWDARIKQERGFFVHP